VFGEVCVIGRSGDPFGGKGFRGVEGRWMGCSEPRPRVYGHCPLAHSGCLCPTSMMS
jgi:hypothetical protein